MISCGTAAAGTAVTGASLFRTPPGPATLLLAASSGTIYAGPGTAVTTGNGFPVVAGAVPPVLVPVYAGSQGQTWSCVTSTGTGSLSWIVSDPSAGTGP